MSEGEERIVVIGLGYVGLPLAVALAKSFDVLGFDIDERRVAELRSGHDRTHEVDAAALAGSSLRYTSQASHCAGADIYVVTVPTPVDQDNQPDLRPVIGATEAVAAMLDPERKPIVVYESTVYPGSPRIFAGLCSSACPASGAARTSSSATAPSASIRAIASIRSTGSPSARTSGVRESGAVVRARSGPEYVATFAAASPAAQER